MSGTAVKNNLVSGKNTSRAYLFGRKIVTAKVHTTLQDVQGKTQKTLHILKGGALGEFTHHLTQSLTKWNGPAKHVFSEWPSEKLWEARFSGRTCQQTYHTVVVWDGKWKCCGCALPVCKRLSVTSQRPIEPKQNSQQWTNFARQPTEGCEQRTRPESVSQRFGALSAFSKSSGFRKVKNIKRSFSTWVHPVLNVNHQICARLQKRLVEQEKV